jgi:hypothetical protein
MVAPSFPRSAREGGPCPKLISLVATRAGVGQGRQSARRGTERANVAGRWTHSSFQISSSILSCAANALSKAASSRQVPAMSPRSRCRLRSCVMPVDGWPDLIFRDITMIRGCPIRALFARACFEPVRRAGNHGCTVQFAPRNRGQQCPPSRKKRGK